MTRVEIATRSLKSFLPEQLPPQRRAERRRETFLPWIRLQSPGRGHKPTAVCHSSSFPLRPHPRPKIAAQEKLDRQKYI